MSKLDTDKSSWLFRGRKSSAVTMVGRMRSRGFGGIMFGGAIICIVIMMALFAPLIAPHDPYHQDLTRRLVPPFWYESGSLVHPFGTDHLGRDYLSRLVYGSRVALVMAFGVVLIAGSFGVAIGVLAGYFGGKVDWVISFFINVRLSMPVVLVALAVVAVAGGSITVVILVLGALLWDQFAVVSRGAVLQLRSREYVLASRAAGCSTWHILFREILPNVSGPIIVVTTLEMAHAILLEAALSFLGLGVQPPLPSWGLMIAEGRNYLFFDGWLVAIPGVALVVLVFAINLVGDNVRDISAMEKRV